MQLQYLPRFSLFVFQNIEISLNGLSATPGKCTAVKLCLVHRVELLACKLVDALAIEELYRCFTRLAIEWARALAKITSPGRIISAHHIHLGFGDLTLALSYGAEAILSLSPENSGRARALTRAAMVTGGYLAWGDRTEKLR